MEPGSGQLLTKRSSSGIHVFELAFEYTEDILNVAFRYVWHSTKYIYIHIFFLSSSMMFGIYTNVLFDSHVSVRLPGGRFTFWGDLTRPSATIAAVDQF